MDDLEAIYNLNRDKALGVLTAADNLLVFFMVSFISVFIPLAFTVTDTSHETIAILMNFVLCIPVVIIPISIFFAIRYREYEDQYKIALIKSIVQKISTQLSNKTQAITYDEICHEIVNKTEFTYDETMTLLIKLYSTQLKN